MAMIVKMAPKPSPSFTFKLNLFITLPPCPRYLGNPKSSVFWLQALAHHTTTKMRDQNMFIGARCEDFRRTGSLSNSRQSKHPIAVNIDASQRGPQEWKPHTLPSPERHCL